MGLLKVDSIDRAFEKLKDAAQVLAMPAMELPLDRSIGFILYEDVYANEDIPGFARAVVDGYAVCAKDTAASGENIPVLLKLVGQVEMGCGADFSIKPGECAEVSTGGMLPDGADAVVMVEYTAPFGVDGVAVSQGVSAGENTIQPGEDAASNTRILARGKRIGPSEIGVLAAAGVVEVKVFRPLRLAVISTGDELVPPEVSPARGQIRDINTYALSALARENGFEVVRTAVLRDDDKLLEAELRAAMAACDIVTVSGGSSQGKKDMTREVIDRVSSPGVFTHGLALKPGKPTILGVDKQSRTIFAGLPGHPVSAIMVFEILLARLWRHLTGAAETPAVPASLTKNAPSAPGKTTLWPVKLIDTENGYLAEPVFGKSGLMTTLTNADGYVVSQRNAEGIAAGSTVFVHLF